MKKLFLTTLFLFSICQVYTDFSQYKQETNTILQKLRNNESLENYKIYVHSWKKSSDHDTPPLDVQPWDKKKKEPGVRVTNLCSNHCSMTSSHHLAQPFG